MTFAPAVRIQILEIVRMVLFGRPNGFCLERAGFRAAEPLRALSVKQAAARSIPPPRCHSERQRRIFALKSASRSYSRKTVFIISSSECQKKRGSEGGQPDPLRESSDYNCGRTMKRKDSSSRAPQNDNEKRNNGGQPHGMKNRFRKTERNLDCFT